MEKTNSGFGALYPYHDDPEEAYLDRALGPFQRALEHSGPDPVHLFSLATSKSNPWWILQAQEPIMPVQQALELCESCHTDQPATLLFLAQALLSRLW